VVWKITNKNIPNKGNHRQQIHSTHAPYIVNLRDSRYQSRSQGRTGEPDEILIEIKEKTQLLEKTEPGGRGRDPFTYSVADYNAVAIENLTHPDRKVAYE